MGSSGIDPSKSIDSSVGGLVWVRRRNGSWWPGRILGPDELPENCVPLPRLGTPIKLLGRLDASVDWYNIEKSKRIKAFRCGEYDDCIEKAKIASANLSKKAVKYAIVQALELERARLGIEHHSLSDRPDIHAGEPNDGDEFHSSFYTSKECDVINEDLFGRDMSDSSCSSQESKKDSASAQELSHSGVSLEESDLVDLPKEGSSRWKPPNDSEDDGTEGVKRMRELQDLGMGVVSSLKRKRSQVVHVHEFLKRKNRRRTLSKVMECTPVVLVPVSALSNPSASSVPGSSESKISRLESNEAKKSVSDVGYLNSDSKEISCEYGSLSKTSNNTNNTSLRCKEKENGISSPIEVLENDSLESLFDVPLITEEQHPAGASQKAWIGAGESSQRSQIETLSLRTEEDKGSGSTYSAARDIHDISQIVCQRMEKGTSDWQLKGKRNSRSRKMGVDDEADPNIDRASFQVGPGQNLNVHRVGGILMSDCYDHQVKSRSISQISVKESQSWSWNARKDSHLRGFSAELPVPLRSLPYRQSRFTVNPKYDSSEFSLRHHVASSGLYEVPVEVKTYHRPQGVPYISLMSKLNGQPIVGLPLTVEKLSDGFCDDLIKMADCYCCSSDFDHNLGEDASSLQDSNMIYGQGSRGRPPRKSGSPYSFNSLTKSPKSRRSIPLSKKTRKLSSLTSAHKNQEQKPIVERLKGPSVACVPLTVVFSRINAAMNNSMRPVPHLFGTNR